MHLSYWLRSFLQRIPVSRHSAPRRRKSPVAVSSAMVEHLESRQLLSAAAVTPAVHQAAASPTIVATLSTNGQAMPQIASDASGDYVVAWMVPNGSAIDAQRYHSNGSKDGSEFQVVHYLGQYSVGSVSVAMDAGGDFVVSWTRLGPRNQSTGPIQPFIIVGPPQLVNDGVFAQYYKSTGAAVGGTITVSGAQYAQAPSVAMDSAGEFVVAWLTPGDDIDAQRFNSKAVAETGAFQVDSLSGYYVASAPAIAMDNSGALVISWSDSNNSVLGAGGNLPSDIFARQYNSADIAQGTEINVSSGTFVMNNESKVAMDASGGFVVTWLGIDTSPLLPGGSEAIVAREYSAVGVPKSLPVTVAQTFGQSGNPLSNPWVAADAAGDFVVTWSATQGATWSNSAQLFASPGQAIGSKIQVGNNLPSSNAVVTMTPTGEFIAVWQAAGPKTGQQSIYTQSYQLPPPQVTEVLLGSGPQVISSGEKIPSPVNSVSVVFNRDMNSVKGGANSVTNPANWTLRRDGINITKLISTITFSFNQFTNQYTAVIAFSQPLPKGRIQLVAKKQIETVDGKSLNSGPGGSNTNFTLKFTVTN